MAYVTGRCPNCGGEVQLDESKEKGFCLHCGSPIQVREAVARLKVEHSGAVQLSGVATDDSLVEYGYTVMKSNLGEADKQFHEALKINTRNWRAWKGLVDVWLERYLWDGTPLYMNERHRCNSPIEEQIWNHRFRDFLSHDIEDADLGLNSSAPNKKDSKVTWFSRCPVKVFASGGFNAICGTILIHNSSRSVRPPGFSRDFSISDWMDFKSYGGMLWPKVLERYEQNYFIPLGEALNNAIKYAPDNEKKELMRIKSRFLDYPKEMCAALMEQARQRAAGLCVHCGGKVGLMGKCKNCGKPEQ